MVCSSALQPSKTKGDDTMDDKKSIAKELKKCINELSKENFVVTDKKGNIVHSEDDFDIASELLRKRCYSLVNMLIS